jgi:hypothetical protein
MYLNNVFVVQNNGDPISTAFIAVQIKESRYEAFSALSGVRLGTFKIEGPIPWDPNTIIDPLGIRAPKRVPPSELSDVGGGQAVVFSEIRKYDKNGEDLPQPPSFEVLWLCPGPDMGNAIITVNFKRRFQTKWERLTYSLKESATR